eukprot:839119-Prorocentrum_minimum.AAC.5
MRHRLSRHARVLCRPIVLQRAIGRDTFFLTGTDEHGIKVEQSAEKFGVPPQQLADENSAAFREAMQSFGLSFDDFIRTTDARHKDQVTPPEDQ